MGDEALLGSEPTDVGEERQLWAAWRLSADYDARQRLVVRYLPYARRVAARLYRQRGPGGVEFDEYYQLACIGMLEALDRYDETHGASFETFSVARIEGNILNGLSKLTEVGEQIGLRRRLQRERLASLKEPNWGGGRTARETLVYLSDVAVGLAIGFMLDESAMFTSDEAAVGADSVYAGAAWKQTRERVISAVGLLPERERQIVALHYFHSLGFEQIASVFGLTKGRISQIHRVALERLKSSMGTSEQFHLVR